MPNTTILTAPRYSRLLKDIRKIIAKGRQRAAEVANNELVQAYWEVGERITKEGLVENAGYGDAILEDLSEELNIDVSTLKRCVSFFQTYNRATSSTYLTWSHYKYLLPLNDPQERKNLKNQVAFF